MPRADTSQRFDSPHWLSTFSHPAERLAAPTLFSVAWLVGLVAFSLAFGSLFDRLFKRWHFIGLGGAVALTMLGFLAWLYPSLARRARGVLAQPVQSFAGPAAITIVACAAVVARLMLLQWLPADYTSFEEMQMGGEGQRAIESGQVQLHFRVTTLFAGTSLALRGNDLAGLRWLFIVAGLASIVVIVVGLRRFGLGLPAIALGAVMFSTTRWLVLGGGVADELFSSMLFATVILTALLAHEKAESTHLAWAGIAGLAAGLLFYEYDSYKPIIALPVMYWLVRAATSEDRIAQRRLLRSGTAYVVTLVLLGSSALHSVLTLRGKSPFLDGYSRNEAVRDTTSAGLSDSLDMLVLNLRVMFGLADTTSSHTYRLPDGSVMPWLVGLLLLAGLVGALRRPRSAPLPFAFATTATLMIVASALLVSNFNPGRLTPILPVLIVLAAIEANRWATWFNSRFGIAPRYVAAAMALIVVLVGVLNAQSVRAMRDSEDSQVALSNTSFLACAPVADQSHQFANVLTHDQGFRCFDENDQEWMYPDLSFTTLHADLYASDTEFVPDTLVLMSKHWGLTEGEQQLFSELAERLGSETTLQTFPGILGRAGTMTFCFECSEATPG